MTKTTNTPEIWEPHVGLDYACVMLPGENTDTASISVHTDCPDERDRLLNMISATPDLLAAAKRALILLEGMAAIRRPGDAMSELEAAIAKAGGAS